MDGPVAAIPERAVLVHIGPPKTGTTSLQTALHQQRPRLREHGVLYPGRTHRQKRPGFALLQRQAPDGSVVPMSEWEELARTVREAADHRVCVSSESFARANRQQVRRIVEDFGAERVHMVVAARRLDRLLPSAWQQRVKGVRETLPYGQWLAEVLHEADSGAGATFWRHHGLGATLADWRAFLPPERIHVVVADETDRTQLLRVFEQLLGLPDGVLTPADAGGTAKNTSLGYGRAELLRRVNVVLGELGEDEVRRRLFDHLRRGLLHADPEPDEPAIPRLPRWAAVRVAELSRAQVAEITSAGVQVIGDPDTLLLTQAGDQAEELPPPPTVIPIATVVSAFASVLDRAVEQGPRTEHRGTPGDTGA